MTATSLSAGRLVVEVGYVDGAAAGAAYARDHARSLCPHTLACGLDLSVGAAASAASPSPLPSLGPSANGATLIKVGEEHALSAKLRVCASGVSAPDFALYGYDTFPLAQAVHGSPLAVGARAALSDLCAGGGSFPSVIRVGTCTHQPSSEPSHPTY